VRILHVTQPTVAGVPVVVQQLAADQMSHGVSVAVASPPDGDLPVWLREAGIQHFAWHATRGPGPAVVSEARALTRLLREVTPDLVHLHSSKAGLAGRLSLRGRIPTVFQPHAWSFDAVDGAQRLGAQSWERFAVRWTDLLVCVSDQEREAGERAGVRAEALIIPNGVDVLRLVPAGDAERRRARALLGLPDRPLIVCVGRLARQKGQDLLIAALPRLLEQVPDALVVLVGDGPDEAVLRSSAPPAVVFAGKRSDVAKWLIAADVVALPSRWEAGLSLVAMEAMAVGRSIVAFDVAGARAGLAGAGAVVQIGVVPALADALAARLADPAMAAEEGRFGRARVEKEHNEADTAPRVRRAYGRVLEQAS
jgi:glycosyltransferase involved in cell wall biosynthesis